MSEYDGMPVQQAWASNDVRQKCLPTYVVIDASASMQPHEDLLNSVLEQVHETIAESPRVSEFALMSIIAFSTQAHVVLEMTDLEDVPGMPRVSCSGATSYGAAFDLVRQRISVDVDALNQSGRAVLRPAVFLFTDGAPTDQQWRESFARLTDRAWPRRPHVITYGFGTSGVDVIQKVATKAAFIAEPGISVSDALSTALSELVKSLVTSSEKASLQIPGTADGFISIPVEYMD